MFTDRYSYHIFPYDGIFNRNITNDSEFINDGLSTKKEILKCKCDFQEVSLSKDQKSYDDAKYVVYFEIPLNDDNEKRITIKNGDIFSIIINGISIEGKVTGIIPSQLGCKVYIADDITKLDEITESETDVKPDSPPVSDLDKQYYNG